MTNKRSLSCIGHVGKLGMIATLLVLGIFAHAALCSTSAFAHSMNGHAMKMNGSSAWGKMQRWSGPDPDHHRPPFRFDARGFDTVNRNATSFSRLNSTQTIVTLYVPRGSYLVTATGSARVSLLDQGTTSILSSQLQCSIVVPGGLTGGAVDTVSLGLGDIETLAVTDSVTLYTDGQIQFVCAWLNPGLLGGPQVDGGASITAVKVKLNEYDDSGVSSNPR